MPGIYLIVEGHGEERAAPRLFANILSNHLRRADFFFWPAFRVSRGGIATTNDEMKAALATARATIARQQGNGILFVLLDADDDCAVTLAQGVRVSIANGGFPFACSVVVCVREYEAWFLASAQSLVGLPNVRIDARNSLHPEGPRDAKGAVQATVLKPGAVYSPTVDQPKFSSTLDVAQALTSRSFRKLVRELDQAILT